MNTLISSFFYFTAKFLSMMLSFLVYSLKILFSPRIPPSRRFHLLQNNAAVFRHLHNGFFIMITGRESLFNIDIFIT